MARNDQILAFAVASECMAAVFVAEGKLKEWKMWRRAVEDTTIARSKFRIMVAKLSPDLILIEDPWTNTKKSGQSLAVLQTLAQAAEDEPVGHALMERVQRYENRYDEAKILSERFPQIRAWCPKPPKSFETESRHLVYFEALAYVAEALDAPEV